MCGRFGNASGSDEIIFEVLADGTVKILTGSIAGDAHMSAEKFVAWLETELAAPGVRTKRAHTHQHQHPHARRKVQQ